MAQTALATDRGSDAIAFWKVNTSWHSLVRYAVLVDTVAKQQVAKFICTLSAPWHYM